MDPGLRAAVEAALGELARAYVVDQSVAGSLAAERGRLTVRERIEGADRFRVAARPPSCGASRTRWPRQGADACWCDAIRRDATGAARALLERALWVPGLDAALGLQPLLPFGWLVATRDGEAVVDAFSIRVGRGDAPLEARAEAERLSREVDALRREATEAQREMTDADAAVAEARATLSLRAP